MCVRWLEEASTDFRVGSSVLRERNLRFSIFGCGNSLYGENFNAAAKLTHSQVCALLCQASLCFDIPTATLPPR